MHKSNYNINLTLKQARKNGELVSIGQNQAILSLFRILGKTYNQYSLNTLFEEKRKIKNRRSNAENITKLLEIESTIDQTLFVPQFISLVIDKKSHYNHIVDKHFVVNGREYVRMACGAGHARNNRVIFVQKEYEKQLKTILNNGRKDVPIILSKFNAYFALAFSSILPVSNVKFCVIPDYEVEREEVVDFVDDHERIIERKMNLSFNLFDGQGIISPKQAAKWAKEIGIEDYIPSTFIIRNIFLKGMVCVMDFHSFAQQNQKFTMKDVWGNDVDIRTVDLILTASQFKMWNAYDSLKDYSDKLVKNHMTWGISRFAPKVENEFSFSNYQFLQALDINDDEIIYNLCDKTLEYFDGVVNKDVDKTLIYLLGKIINDYDENIIDKINDNVAKALILNKELIDDPFIKSHLIHSLNKKIKESYIGNLIFDGNYQTMIADPYAFMQYALGLFPITGLLNNKEHYSKFWLDKDVKEIVAMRAPLTWRSEVNKLNIVENSNINHWYQYLKSGIVYNIYGIDTMLEADSDFDGDLSFTTDAPEIVNNVFGGNPITYEKKKGEKKCVLESDLAHIDSYSFDTRIGYITNNSTTLYAMLPMFDRNSKEYNEIINRLKYCRFLQGTEIDKTKNLTSTEFPKHWTTYTSIKMDMSDDDKDLAQFNNSILIEKRPYFFRYLYSYLNKKYLKHLKNYTNYCISYFGFDIKVLVEKYRNGETLSDKEKEVISNYNRYNPLLETNCLMNNICNYMETHIKEIKKKTKHDIIKEKIQLLKNTDIELDKEKLKKLYDLYKRYKREKRNFVNVKDANGEEIYKTIEQYNKIILQEAYEISSDISELANLAVTLCYDMYPNDSKTFAWNIFGDGIIKNIMFNNSGHKRYIPFLDNTNGDIQYLGSKYLLKEINI